MKLCSSCFMKAGIRVDQPQLLTIHIGCESCKSPSKKSYDMEAVVMQVVK